MKKAMIVIGMFLTCNAYAFEFCKSDPKELNALLQDKMLRSQLLGDADFKKRYGGLMDGVSVTKVHEGVAIVFGEKDIKGKEVCVNLGTKRIYTKTGRVITDANTLLPGPTSALTVREVASVDVAR